MDIPVEHWVSGSEKGLGDGRRVKGKWGLCVCISGTTYKHLIRVLLQGSIHIHVFKRIRSYCRRLITPAISFQSCHFTALGVTNSASSRFTKEKRTFHVYPRPSARDVTVSSYGYLVAAPYSYRPFVLSLYRRHPLYTLIILHCVTRIPFPYHHISKKKTHARVQYEGGGSCECTTCFMQHLYGTVSHEI